MMYKSQFQNIDPYDWFCGPVCVCIQYIYIYINLVHYLSLQKLLKVSAPLPLSGIYTYFRTILFDKLKM